MMLTLTITDATPPESFSFEVLDVEYTKQNLVTQHPVENFADVSDHIQRQLDELYLRVIVTDTPLSAAASPAAGSKSPIRAAEDFLERAALGTVSCAIVGRPTYPRTALLAWPWRQDKYGRAIFSLRLREVRIARALSVKIPPAASSSTAGVPSRQDLGQQSTGEVDGSILAGLAGLGG